MRRLGMSRPSGRAIDFVGGHRLPDPDRGATGGAPAGHAAFRERPVLPSKQIQHGHHPRAWPGFAAEHLGGHLVGRVSEPRRRPGRPAAVRPADRWRQPRRLLGEGRRGVGVEVNRGRLELRRPPGRRAAGQGGSKGCLRERQEIPRQGVPHFKGGRRHGDPRRRQQRVDRHPVRVLRRPVAVRRYSQGEGAPLPQRRREPCLGGGAG